MLRNFFKIDWVLAGAILLILGISLLVLYSFSISSPAGNYFFKQSAYIGIGLFSMFLFASLDYRYFTTRSVWGYFSILLVLTLVLIWGKTVRGTSGWLEIGFFQFQPVEVAKFVLIVFLSRFISRKKSELSETVRLTVSLLLSATMVMLVLRQPDLGSALVLAGIWAIMSLVSGISKKNLLVLAIATGLVAGGGWFLLADFQKDRIYNFIHPENDPRGSGYNVIQSMVSVGSGGMTGKGIGKGSQSQLNFLPEKHTDFIFAAIAEELGFAGVAFTLGLFGVILYRLKSIAANARDNEGYLLAVGVMAMVFIQLTVNVGMNMGLLPVTGIPLPLVSYGGSSLIATLAALGVVLNVASQKKQTLGPNDGD